MGHVTSDERVDALAAYHAACAAKVSEPAADDSRVIWDDGMINGCAGNWLSKAIKQGGSARLDEAIAEEWRHAVAHDIDAVIARVNYSLAHGPGSDWSSAINLPDADSEFVLVLKPKADEVTRLKEQLAVAVANGLRLVSQREHDKRTIAIFTARLNEAVCTSPGEHAETIELLRAQLKDAETELKGALVARDTWQIRASAPQRSCGPRSREAPTALATVSWSEDPEVRLYDQSHELAMLKTSNEHALAVRRVPVPVKAVYIGLGALLTMTLAQLSPLLN